MSALLAVAPVIEDPAFTAPVIEYADLAPILVILVAAVIGVLVEAVQLGQAEHIIKVRKRIETTTARGTFEELDGFIISSGMHRHIGQYKSGQRIGFGV